MPTIDISAGQAEYLDDLRSDLEERHVDTYGTVRPRDALQFLIDRYEDGDEVEATNESEERAEEETAEADDGSDDESGDDDSEGGGPGRLQAMMQLLDEHDEKWESVDSDQGKYAVELPDGSTENVRTKDDVRALLFQHYR